jgi:hypothetical protein
MRIPCEFSNTGKWQPGWILSFIYDSENHSTYVIVERESGGLLELYLYQVRTKMETQKGES